MSSAKKGIKRSLALSTCAVMSASALAIVTAPAAQAAPNDEITIGYQGPVRNAGTESAVLVLETKGLTAADAPNIKIIKTDLAGEVENDPTGLTVTSPSQAVTLTAPLAGDFVANASDSDPSDGFDEITLRYKVTTPQPGNPFAFAAFVDDNGDGNVDADEARIQVSGNTAGAPSAIELDPTARTSVVGTPSEAYKLTVRDSAGRATQLSGSEALDITEQGPGALTYSGAASDDLLTAAETASGRFEFTATAGTAGAYSIRVSGDGAMNSVADTVAATASLTASAAATITENEVDIVTGADSWDGFNDGGAGDFTVDTQVRVDQTPIVINFKSNDPGETVRITASAPVGQITFGGSRTQVFTTTLNSQGEGSITITPDAGTVADGRSISLSGTIAHTLDFVRADESAANTNAAASQYTSAFGGSVNVVVTVRDQFGLPVQGASVDAQRLNGVNADATPSPRQLTNAAGEVTFTLTDTKATATSRAADQVQIRVFADQFDPSVEFTKPVATIQYSSDGAGPDFNLNLDNQATNGPGYTPGTVTVVPLADAIADSIAGATGDEAAVVSIVGGTIGAPVTVSASDGALILRNPVAGVSDRLTDAAASKTGVVGDTFWVVGTTAGVKTVTVASGNRTKTAQFTVEPATNIVTARNVEVVAPASSASGEIATFTGKVTDAFGNGIEGLSIFNTVGIQVSGPARLQDNDLETDENGEFAINVRLDDDADAPVTVRVAAVTSPQFPFAQFGAAANRLDSNDTTNTAPGLAASQATDSATVSDVVNIAELEQALEVAQANLGTAQANLAIAQARVAEERADVRKAKRKLANADTRRETRKAKRQLRTQRQQLELARTARAAAAAAVTAAQAEVDAAQAALDEAQA